MFDLIADSPLRFVLALLVGIATGWWIWARWGANADSASPDAGAASDSGAAGSGGAEAGAAEVAQAEPDQPAAAVAAASLAAPIAARTGEGEGEGEGEEVAAAAPRRAAAKKPRTAKPKIAAAVGADDDLRKIKGIGPKLNDLLATLGVRRFDQIAAWTKADIAEVDQNLGTFRGRIERDEWIAQSKLLAAGKLAAWEKKYGGGTNT